MTTTQISLNDGFSTLYVPSRDEIWRDNSGSPGDDTTWRIQRYNIISDTYGIAIPLGLEPIGEIMRLDPDSGHVFVPVKGPGPLSTAQRYLHRINPIGPTFVTEIELEGINAFQFAYWQFNEYQDGDLWGAVGPSVNGTPRKFGIWDKGDGHIGKYIEVDTPYFTNSANQGNSYIQPILFTPDDKIWLMKTYIVASVRHVVIQRYDISGTWVSGAQTPDFELDLAGVANQMVYDATDNAIWFLFNTPAFSGPFFGFEYVKKLDLATGTVTETVALPEAVALDSREFEILRISGRKLWIVNELTPTDGYGKLYSVDMDTAEVIDNILLEPYEFEGCFGGTIAVVTSTDVWHGDAGCGYLYKTPYQTCEGGPGNHFPYEPPPDGEEMQAIKEVMINQQWQPVIIPLDARNFGNQLPRELSATLGNNKIFANQAWRDLFIWDGNPPPPNTTEPPFYDPCDRLGVIPPSGTLDPLASTVRFFGMSGAPMSVCGDLFSGTKIAIGYWTASDLTKGAAKSVTLITGQGPYKQYQLNGYWDRDTFVAVTIARITPLLASLQAATPGGLYIGHSIMDDFESKILWPKIGDKLDELADALALIRIACPDIRYGDRRVPSKLPFNLGFDFYNAQFESWRGISAFDFGVLEYTAALNFGAYISLDLNFLHGGNGSSGYRFANGTQVGMSAHNFECSPAEVYNYISDMLDGALSVDGTCANLLGVAGYQYDPTFLGRAGMIDAMVAARNKLASLPPR